jgi:glycosyltransferase involved in cell wall biosynthesis
MACPGPSAAEYVPPSFPAEPTVLWVGRLVPDKRPDWLLEIAARLPDVKFEVAGASANVSPFIASLLDRAEKLPNVNWLGTVPRERMPELYQRALCLCSTSVHEGFPNTFLESWSHGKPLLTTFDPDDMVSRLNLGAAVRDIDGFVKEIRALLLDPNRWMTMSRNARALYEANYTVEASNSQFEQQFRSVCGRR